jgi:hypothetical protein
MAEEQPGAANVRDPTRPSINGPQIASEKIRTWGETAWVGTFTKGRSRGGQRSQTVAESAATTITCAVSPCRHLDARSKAVRLGRWLLELEGGYDVRK